MSGYKRGHQFAGSVRAEPRALNDPVKREASPTFDSKPILRTFRSGSNPATSWAFQSASPIIAGGLLGPVTYPSPSRPASTTGGGLFSQVQSPTGSGSPARSAAPLFRATAMHTSSSQTTASTAFGTFESFSGFGQPTGSTALPAFSALTGAPMSTAIPSTNAADFGGFGAESRPSPALAPATPVDPQPQLR